MRGILTAFAAVALVVTVATHGAAAGPGDIESIARAKAASLLGVSPAALVEIDLVLGGTLVGGREYAMAKFTNGQGKVVFVAVDVRDGTALGPDEFEALLHRDRTSSGRDKVTKVARAALDANGTATLGFFLGSVDYSSAIASTIAAYPTVQWMDGYPVNGRSDEIQAARRGLLLAKAEANRLAATSLVDEARRLGLEEPFVSDLMPLVIVTAGREAAEALAARSDVAAVRLGGPMTLDMDSAYADIQAQVPWEAGHRGSGARLAVVEYGKIDFSVPGMSTVTRQLLRVTGTSSLTCSSGEADQAPPSYGHAINKHMTRVAAILVAKNGAVPQRGLAPQATLVVASANVSNDEDVTADRRIIKAAECAVVNGNEPHWVSWRLG
jgi:hypothetical protein